MVPATYIRLVLAEHLKKDDMIVGPGVFRAETSSTPQPGEGQALVQVLYLSVDPVQRGKISVYLTLTIRNHSQ